MTWISSESGGEQCPVAQALAFQHLVRLGSTVSGGRLAWHDGWSHLSLVIRDAEIGRHVLIVEVTDMDSGEPTW